MGLLLAISKDDIETFSLAEPDGSGGYDIGTVVSVLGDDIWDCHLNAKRMIEWALTKHGKVRVKITKHPVISFDPFDLGYNNTFGAHNYVPAVTMPGALNPNDGLGTTRDINTGMATINLTTGNITGSWSGVEHWPVDTPMPGDPAHDAPFGPQSWGPIASGITTTNINAAKAALLADSSFRDELVDYERLNVNFKSLLCEVTRSKSDPGFNHSDYHAQAVSATKYPQSLYLFEDATGCTGLYFGGDRHDFRLLEIASVQLFGVLVATGDPNLPDPFEWINGNVTKHYVHSDAPASIDFGWVDLLGDDYTAKVGYTPGSYDLILQLQEEFS